MTAKTRVLSLGTTTSGLDEAAFHKIAHGGLLIHKWLCVVGGHLLRKSLLLRGCCAVLGFNQDA
jgi:hypothetical protein